MAPVTGSYTLECWGAQGTPLSGSYAGWSVYTQTYTGGKGGYTKGDISLAASKSLYIFVGNNSLVTSTITDAIGTRGHSFNGGSYCTNSYGTKCGGGATDVRVLSGTWDNFDSLKTRIMVAGGGGSAGDRGDGYGGGPGGYAGGLTGQDGQVDYRGRYIANWYSWIGTGGSQTGTRAGMLWISYNNLEPGWGTDTNIMLGLFGIGANGQDGNGGGGWYGGCGGGHASGAGGSSYISGYSGCRAIKQSSVTNAGGEANHESGSVAIINGVSYTFSNMQMSDGNTSFVSPSGGIETGHSGNGYARITYVNP